MPEEFIYSITSDTDNFSYYEIETDETNFALGSFHKSLEERGKLTSLPTECRVKRCGVKRKLPDFLNVHGHLACEEHVYSILHDHGMMTSDPLKIEVTTGGAMSFYMEIPV